MRIKDAWQSGYTGKGVVVTILDDGIERDHPDLIKNFVILYFIHLFFCFQF
jgi:subtilisin family serine protease